MPVRIENPHLKHEMHGPVVYFVRTAGDECRYLFVTENISQFGYWSAVVVNRGYDLSRLLHSEDVERVKTEINEIICKNQHRYTVEYRLITPKG